MVARFQGCLGLAERLYVIKSYQKSLDGYTFIVLWKGFFR
jgi:hypothetical protein